MRAGTMDLTLGTSASRFSDRVMSCPTLRGRDALATADKMPGYYAQAVEELRTEHLTPRRSDLVVEVIHNSLQGWMHRLG